MTIEEIFIDLRAHLMKGVVMHQTMMEAYDFIGLRGYSKCQEFHCREEMDNYLCIIRYYMNNYQQLLRKKDGEEQVSVFSSSWYKYSRQDVDNNTRRNSIKEFMTKWVNWEEETKTFLQNIYKDLVELNEVDAALLIQTLIQDVTHELNDAKQKLLELEIINYDLVEIMDEQESCYHTYNKKIKKKGVISNVEKLESRTMENS